MSKRSRLSICVRFALCSFGCVAMLAVADVSSLRAQEVAATPPPASESPAAASAASTNSAASASASNAPPSKVWTNDDLAGLHRAPALSTVGAKPKPSGGSGEAPAKSKAAANNYQAQITKLQAQLPPIESQMADLQSALSGNSVNSDRKYTGVKPDDWSAQLADLQKKHADIENQIQALIDQARHSGVPANTLP
jgi:uncharacterized protein YukE